MEKPSYQELKDRILRQMSKGNFTDYDSACWNGYIAALLEWGLISIEEHRCLVEILPKLEPDPTLPIFLGPEWNPGT